MIARYRIVYFVADPFLDSRVAIGALWLASNGPEFVRFDEPAWGQITGASRFLVDHVCASLAIKPDEPGKNRHGLSFDHGKERQTPDVGSPRAWLRLLGTDRPEGER